MMSVQLKVFLSVTSSRRSLLQLLVSIHVGPLTLHLIQLGSWLIDTEVIISLLSFFSVQPNTSELFGLAAFSV